MAPMDHQLEKPMIRLGVGVVIPALLQRFGIRPSDFLEQRGLDISLFADPNNPIPYAVLANLAHDAASATGCEHFGLLVGCSGGLAILGEIGREAARAPTIGAALRLIMTQFGSHNRGAIIVIDETDYACLTYSVIDPTAFPGEIMCDGALAVSMRVMSELCGSKFKPSAVELPRRPPNDRAPYERTFKCHVSFNAPIARIYFERKWLDQPPQVSASALAPSHEQRLSPIMGDDLVSRVSVEVSRRLVANLDISANSVASALGMSRRTLHRELAKRARTYHSISYEVRFAYAKRLLNDTEAPLTEIAISLGYSELSAFTRAFARSFGESPSDWRQRAKASDGSLARTGGAG